MKAIQATPKKIHELFQSVYIIPEFQRPYSWDEEQCTKLFEDITDFFKEHKEASESYYLGNIVIYKDKDKDKDEKFWFVIDGQQRLTTLFLFIKALYSHAITAKGLENLLMDRDILTGEIKKDILKIQSEVNEEDKKDLKDVILLNKIDGKSRIKQNYTLLDVMLTNWIKDDGLGSEDIDSFINILLMNIVLLPIECDSRDDALTLFNTLNDRGKPLGDADIFKAALFESVMNDKEAQKKLKNRWNALNKNDQTDSKKNQIESLFRDYMHVQRAKLGETSKEIAMRTFFFDPKKEIILRDWNSVLSALEKLNTDNMNFEDGDPVEIFNWRNLLDEIPNEYCKYPVKVFWYNNAYTKDGLSYLPRDKEKDYKELITRTVKYYYLYAVAYNAVNKIKDTTYKVCKAIAHKENYLDEYRSKYAEAFIEFDRKIREYRYGRCRRGLVALLALLNDDQDHKKLYDLSEWHVEHILPQEGGYNNYNGWTEEQYDEKLNTLGNFVMLDMKLNIRASNEFFEKKKKEYKNSVIADARALVKLDDWKYEDWVIRNQEREAKLLEFFKTID